jgi:hypothetical protein
MDRASPRLLAAAMIGVADLVARWAELGFEADRRTRR